MNTKQHLIAARDLIKDPANWTRGYLCNKEATCFCALGALRAAKVLSEGSNITKRYIVDTLPKHGVMHALNTSSKNLHNKGIVFVNDYMGHAAVMAAYDKAIEDAG